MYGKKQTISIFSRKLAIYLQLRGFVMLEMLNDKKTCRKKYIFIDSEKIRYAMSQYKSDRTFHEYSNSIAVI